MSKAKKKAMTKDKARETTDKKLKKLENDIGRIYKKSPAIIAIEKEYAKFMAKVQKECDAEYKAYIEEKDKNIKAEKKKAYMDKVRSLTLQSADYNKLIKKIVRVLAQVNQETLNIVNDTTISVYCINYNQVAEDCKKVGIKING